MQQFSFTEMIWYHWMSLTLSLSVGLANCQTYMADKSSLPNSASATLRECDPIFFPNINVLLRILCTLPVTSAECERLFSTLKLLKTYLRSTMTTESQSGLAMKNNHYGRAIDIYDFINIFASRHPRRLLLKDILTGKQSE